MIPGDFQDDLQQDFTVIQQPTLTYRISFDGKPSSGKETGIEAMKQAVFLILNTERFRYEIFSWSYGVELENKMGQQNDPLLQSQIKQAISEALCHDDRITNVSDFEFKTQKKNLNVSFFVQTNHGSFKTEIEV